MICDANSAICHALTADSSTLTVASIKSTICSHPSCGPAAMLPNCFSPKPPTKIRPCRDHAWTLPSLRRERPRDQAERLVPDDAERPYRDPSTTVPRFLSRDPTEILPRRRYSCQQILPRPLPRPRRDTLQRPRRETVQRLCRETHQRPVPRPTLRPGDHLSRPC